MTCCLPRGRVAAAAPLLLAAVCGLVYAGLVAQPYVRRAAGRLDTVQLAMGDSAQREQAAQFVANHWTVLGKAARLLCPSPVIHFVQHMFVRFNISRCSTEEPLKRAGDINRQHVVYTWCEHVVQILVVRGFES